jgi:KUP system potassium uptake protein
VATPAFQHLVLPLTVAILIALFAVQRRGTAKVAAFFGPVMLVWFATLAVSGLAHIRDDPGVLAAIDPSYAARFLLDHGRELV